MNGENMSRVLLIGANGFIGSAIYEHLVKEGHEVIRGVRKVQKKEDYFINYTELCRHPASLKEIPDVDVVINAVGIIEENNQDTFSDLHSEGPRLFFEACYKKGIRKFIQISALGVEKQTTRYSQSKFECDQFLASLQNC